jgi:hypothetical protein
MMCVGTLTISLTKSETRMVLNVNLAAHRTLKCQNLKSKFCVCHTSVLSTLNVEVLQGKESKRVNPEARRLLSG